MCLIVRKHVFRFSVQVRLKPFCSATETSYITETLYVASLTNILSREGITKALTRLRSCAGWSAPLFFACNKIGFSDEAYMYNHTNLKVGQLCKFFSTSHCYISRLVSCMKKVFVKKEAATLVVEPIVTVMLPLSRRGGSGTLHQGKNTGPE